MNVVIIGAGQGGRKLLEALVNHPELRIVCVVDVNPSAPGLALAKEHGVQVASDYTSVVPECRGESIDLILEVTGQPGVYQHLVLIAPHTKVISGVDLRVFMVMIEDKLSLIRELETRQRELQLVLNATHDAMVGINDEGVVTLYNAAAERLLGVSSEDALGGKVIDVIPNSRMPYVLATGQEELNQVQRVNGVEIVTNRVPVFDEHKQIIGVIATFRDITELRQLASEVTDLREVQTLLKAVIESTQDAISVVDKDGKGLIFNPAYTRLTGLKPEQVLNKPAEVDIAEGDSMHMRVLKTRQPVRNVPMKVGPSRREVLVDVAPILVNGDLRGTVGVIHDVSEIKRLTEELEHANKLIRTMQAKYTFDEIAGASSAMLLAIEQAKKAAKTPATVLLRGESGTGKELFAHAIHNESDRKYQPFIRVNCAALSETLLESELFGYEDGAFTGARKGGKRGLFEAASGGTLFLDEIGELSVTTQAKLLRTLQEREIVRVGGTKALPVNVRMIAATHVNLEQAVAKGVFREDLYYRLNVVPIVIPPLRYRREDIKEICMHTIFRHNQSYGRNVEQISPDALEVLKAYHWPGNVRELENTIGRAMIHMGYGEATLEAHHLPLLHTGMRADNEAERSPLEIHVAGHTKLQDVVQKAERWAIEQALRETNGNKTEAARRLGISVRSLYYKMQP